MTFLSGYTIERDLSMPDATQKADNLTYQARILGCDKFKFYKPAASHSGE